MVGGTIHRTGPGGSVAAGELGLCYFVKNPFSGIWMFVMLSECVIIFDAMQIRLFKSLSKSAG
jgi:hypothetical protein